MHRFRIRAGFAALAVVLVATGCKWNGFADSSIQSTTLKARTWLVHQQQAGGGFEVAGFDGFETPDAIVAIAEQAQQQSGWNTDQARAAVRAVKVGGKSALDWADDFADGPINAGQAAKLIVLVAKPLGLGVTTYDPQGDAREEPARDRRRRGAARRLLRRVQRHAVRRARQATRERRGAGEDARLHPRRAAGVRRVGLRRTIRTRPTPMSTARASRSRPSSPRASPRPTPTSSRAWRSSRDQQRSNGAWQSFGADDPNSTATAILAITAVGESASVSCWRDRAVPALHGTAYSSPLGWLRNQQASDGHLTSPNDAFPPVSTFATTQGVEALRRGWLPVAYEPLQLCT